MPYLESTANGMKARAFLGSSLRTTGTFKRYSYSKKVFEFRAATGLLSYMTDGPVADQFVQVSNCFKSAWSDFYTAYNADGTVDVPNKGSFNMVSTYTTYIGDNVQQFFLNLRTGVNQMIGFYSTSAGGATMQMLVDLNYGTLQAQGTTPVSANDLTNSIFSLFSGASLIKLTVRLGLIVAVFQRGPRHCTYFDRSLRASEPPCLSSTTTMAAEPNSSSDSLSKPGLPYDIQLRILDAAISDPSLISVVHALAQTHHALLPPCQKHLFSTINYDEQVSFLKSLEIYPYIGSYVRTLEMCTHCLRMDNLSRGGPRFLNELRHLQHLLIFNPDTPQDREYYRTFNWGTIPTCVDTAFVGLCRAVAPILRSFDIDGVHYFPAKALYLLSRSPNLRLLKLRDLHVEEDPSESKYFLVDGCEGGRDKETSNGDGGELLDSNASDDRRVSNSANLSETVSPPHFLKLDVGVGCTQSLRFLLGVTDMPSPPMLDFSLVQIRELSLVWEGSDETEKTAVEKCSSAEELDIMLNINHLHFRYLADSIIKGPCETLQKLKLSQPLTWAALSVESYADHDVFRGSISELALLAGHVNVLNLLELDFNTYIERSENLEPTCNTVMEQYEELDELLANRVNFPALQKLHICITFTVADKDSSERTRAVKDKFDKMVVRAQEQCFNKLAAFPWMDVKLDMQLVRGSAYSRTRIVRS